MNTLTVTSPCFDENGLIPVRYTGHGDDISPELVLSKLDSSAKSIAVIMNDRGHPIPNYNHWVIWNIPVMQTIPQDIPHGARIDSLGGAVQGRGYGKHRYRGPKPPFNWSHKYAYNVYVLDSLLDLPETSRKRDVLRAMEGHILQQGTLVGHYR